MAERHSIMSETITIHTRFQQRRGTAARWSVVNPILREGEIGLELDTRRIKFGDGITAWNDLEYSTRELLPASNVKLGGVIAGDKGKNYTVEVQIDPTTHRLYVPAYPVMPPLAAVATSGDYNDLDNTPAPYTLPAATATSIGGVAAAPKTIDYTVEVKKDPASHKLYVPASSSSEIVLDDGRLPGLVIRVIYKQEGRSKHFVNEIGEILNADIYFRPLCSQEYFNQILPDLQIGIARCTTRHRQKRAKKPDISTRSTQWHVVGPTSISLSSDERYPKRSTFPYNFNNCPNWTYNDLEPVKVSSLINEYIGQWIRFPYDLETVVRRFIYIYQKQGTVSPYQCAILPIQTIHSNALVNYGYVKIAGIRNRTPLTMARTKMSEYYASVNLGFCFCRFLNHPSNFMRYMTGPIAEKRAMVMGKLQQDKICYYLKEPQRKKLMR